MIKEIIYFVIGFILGMIAGAPILKWLIKVAAVGG